MSKAQTDNLVLEYAENAQKYVEQAIESFKNDPPSNDFQKGYLEALKTVLAEAFPL